MILFCRSTMERDDTSYLFCSCCSNYTYFFWMWYGRDVLHMHIICMHVVYEYVRIHTYLIYKFRISTPSIDGKHWSAPPGTSDGVVTRFEPQRNTAVKRGRREDSTISCITCLVFVVPHHVDSCRPQPTSTSTQQQHNNITTICQAGTATVERMQPPIWKGPIHRN
jgi:hypothetical protein